MEKDDKRLELQETPGVAYVQLLMEARQVSEQAMQKLRDLCAQFPTEIPDQFLDQLERIRVDPQHERRRYPRISDRDAAISVTQPSELTQWRPARVVDRSPGGMALRLDRAVAVGDVFLVWIGTAEKAWVPLEVRYCRADGVNWIVGGSFVSEAVMSEYPVAD